MDGSKSAVENRDSNRLIAADRVEGTAVYNRKGEKLGSIENIMIDKYSGRVAYAVMAFGGFLGLVGDHHHPLPWSVLDYSPQMGGYVVDLDKERLDKAPRYANTDKVTWEDPVWNKTIHQYYGVVPTWL